MADYIVKRGQSIYDIAVEKYGSVLGVSNILEDNPLIDLTTILEAGDVLVINSNSSTIYSQNNVNFFSNRIITNTEDKSAYSFLSLSGLPYGELNTSRPDYLGYINSSMWGKPNGVTFKNNIGENIFTGINNGTFSADLLNNDGDGWGVDIFKVNLGATNEIGQIIGKRQDSTGNDLMYVNYISDFSGSMDVINSPFNILKFTDNSISMSAGVSYEISSDILIDSSSSWFQNNQIGNARIYLSIDGQDESDMVINDVEVNYYDEYVDEIIISPTMQQYNVVKFFTKTVFTPKSNLSSAEVSLKLSLENSIGTSTGGSFFVDNLSVRRLLSDVTYDSVKFSKKYFLSNNFDRIQMQANISESNMSERGLIVACDSEGNSKITVSRLLDGYGVKIYGEDKTLLFSSTTPISFGSDLYLDITCDILANSTSFTKTYLIFVDTEYDSVVYDGQFSLDMLGSTESIGENFEGYISRININGDNFNFNEGSDIYINRS